MISFAEVAIGSGGLPTCTQCAPRPAFVPRPIGEITAEFSSVASSWDGGPGPNTSLGRGDALAHPQLPAVIAAARAAGFERVRLATSGVALGAHGNALGAIEAGVRQLQLTVVAGGDDHDRLAQAPGEFAAIRTGLRAFNDAARERCARVATVARVPVCRHNIELLGAAAAQLARLGVVAVTFDVAPSAAASVRAGDWILAAVDTATTSGVWATVVGLADDSVPGLHGTAVEQPWDVAP